MESIEEIIVDYQSILRKCIQMGAQASFVGAPEIDTVGELKFSMFPRLCRLDVRNGSAFPGLLSPSHPRLRRKIGGVAADDFQELPGGSKTRRTSGRQSRLIPKPRLGSSTVSRSRARPMIRGVGVC